MGIRSSRRTSRPEVHKASQSRTDCGDRTFGLETKNGKCGAYVTVQGGGYICSHPSGIHLNGIYCDGYPGDCNVFPLSLEALLKPHKPYKGPATVRAEWIGVRKCTETWHHVKIMYIHGDELTTSVELKPICSNCRTVIAKVEKVIKRRQKNEGKKSSVSSHN